MPAASQRAFPDLPALPAIASPLIDDKSMGRQRTIRSQKRDFIGSTGKSLIRGDVLPESSKRMSDMIRF
jgi:hypothetical protein